MHFAFVYYLLSVHSLCFFDSFVKMCLNNCVKQDVHNTSHLENVDKLGNDVIMNCDYLEHDDVWTSNDTELLVVQWNIRGMYSKIDHLKHVIDNNPCNRTPDLILLCEMWLNKQTPNISVPGYNLIRKDRTKKIGGGVAMLIKQGIKYRERRDLSDDTELKCVLLELGDNKQKTIVGSLYRPPNHPPAEFITQYDHLIGKIGQEKKELIIGLDYNLDLLKCNTHKQTENFLETNLEHGLIPTIIRPTRITNSTTTLIDNIMVSKKFLVSLRAVY